MLSQLHNEITVYMRSSYTTYNNTILFNKVNFVNNHHIKHLLYIQYDLHNIYFKNEIVIHNKVTFNNCLFINSTNVSKIVHCKWSMNVKSMKQTIHITNCLFQNITNCTDILKFAAEIRAITSVTIFLYNTKFISNKI